jgi:hypothetical protein
VKHTSLSFSEKREAASAKVKIRQKTQLPARIPDWRGSDQNRYVTGRS